MTLKRVHARRLRDVYRSAGWPYLDVIEIELLAAGLLERVTTGEGPELVRVTDAGIRHIADATQGNRKSRSAHETLVGIVVDAMMRDGRLVWTGLSLRARVADTLTPSTGADLLSENPSVSTTSTQWKMCIPDVFSIRHTSRREYLEPIVHEIKVSRADLLGDLKRPEKRAAYLDVGGQCWYVLGCDAKGRPIGQEDEIPASCGVMIAQDGRLDVVRNAPKRFIPDLPFAMWMGLAKTTPVLSSQIAATQGYSQERLKVDGDG